MRDCRLQKGNQLARQLQRLKLCIGETVSYVLRYRPFVRKIQYYLCCCLFVLLNKTKVYVYFRYLLIFVDFADNA